MGKTIYLLRHCQTFESEHGINGSRVDSPLSENGQKCATELVQQLSEYKFDLIVVSPLQRTQQTVQPFIDSLQQPPKIQIEPLVTERDLGKFTNSKTNDGQISNDIRAQGVGKTNWIPEGGESTAWVGIRAKEFLEIVKNRHEESILLCSHLNFLRCLELVALEEPVDDEHYYSEKSTLLKPGELRILQL